MYCSLSRSPSHIHRRDSQCDGSRTLLQAWGLRLVHATVAEDPSLASHCPTDTFHVGFYRYSDNPATLRFSSPPSSPHRHHHHHKYLFATRGCIFNRTILIINRRSKLSDVTLSRDRRWRNPKMLESAIEFEAFGNSSWTLLSWANEYGIAEHVYLNVNLKRCHRRSSTWSSIHHQALDH